MSYKKELKALCDTYGKALPAKLSDIQADWHYLKHHNERLSNELILKVHSLVGAGATFGFSSLSVAAKELEIELRKYQQEEAKPLKYIDSLEPLFTALEFAAQEPAKYEISVDNTPPLNTATSIDNNTHSILVISSNSLLTTDLSRKLKALKITSHVISSSIDLLTMIEQKSPSCIVFESILEKNTINEIKIIKDICQRFYKAPPLIVISNQHDISVRLLAVRAGAAAYFLSPVNTQELVESIYTQCHADINPPYRIMIVDDDEQFAHHTALILQRAGTNIESRVLTQPLDILQLLGSFQPEVILMDLHMPDCDGIELATVIRQQCIYAGIAIVFFSVETAIDRHLDALRAGGDDFLLKSLPPNQLIAKVEAKAKNARTVQNLMLHDGLTGLLNRSHFIETITQQIAVSQRNKSCFSYVILDLDHFKHVNDSYGHATGDEVLKALAKVIVQRLRSVDRAFRFGGEEFVLVLPNTSANQATFVINDLLHKFQRLEFFSNEQSFSVTFSAGIAQYPDYSDHSYLTEAADKALYQAKKAGRNCIYQAK